MKNVIKQLNLSNEQMKVSKENIFDIMESLAAVAEQNASCTEEVSASTQGQLTSIMKTKETIENFEQLASKLEDEIKRFKI